MNWTTTRLALIGALLAVSSVASATTIVDFKPVPTSPGLPEFGFHRPVGGGPPAFRGEIGATSNGDGNLAPAAQTAPGLDSETPFLLLGPGAVQSAGTTGFYDSSFQFTAGLVANAPALNAGGTFLQQLSPGSFQIMSTTAAGGPILLLSGNVATASVIVGSGDAGAVFDANGVNYTGGIIFNAMVAAGYSVNNNSFSISMVDVSPAFHINPADGFLGDFDANATGLLNANAVPEPSSLTLLALGLVAGVLRLRRR